ncbi:MAG: hypothetical protein GF308_10875 [Candidatus Heimdallarchaeota archaeon]|nr:hypothetical protein [Candidatus Heimdallarchaeota archaeon]
MEGPLGMDVNYRISTLFLAISLLGGTTLFSGSSVSLSYFEEERVQITRNPQLPEKFIADSSTGTFEELGVFDDNLGHLYEIFLNEDILYCRSMEGLAILNVTIITSPKILRIYRNNDFLELLSVENNRAYIKTSQGFDVISLEAPSAPEKIGDFQITYKTFDVFIIDELAYLVAPFIGLEIYDISNLKNIFQVGSYPNEGEFRQVLVSENIAYVINDEDQTLEMIDVSSPSSPSFLNSYNGTFVESMAVEGAFAYLISFSNYLHVVDLSDINSPQELDRERIGHSVNEIIVRDGIVYIVGSDLGLSIINCNNPSQIVTLDSYYDGGNGNHLTIRGELVFVGETMGQGLEIFNVEDPTAIVKVTQFGGGFVNDMCLYNNSLFLSEGVGGIDVLNLTNPANPKKIGRIISGSSFRAVIAEESFAYLLNEIYDLFIISIEDLNNITLLQIYSDQKNYLSMYKQDNYLFLRHDFGFSIIDIANKTKPMKVGEYLDSGYTSDLLIAGNFAFLGYPNKVAIIDISNPQIPLFVKSVSFDNTLVQIIKGKNFLYLCCKSSINEINLDDPVNTEKRTVYTTFEPFEQIKKACIREDILYLSTISYHEGIPKTYVRIFDVSNSKIPRLFQKILIENCYIEAILVQDFLIYLGNSFGEDLLMITTDLDRDGLLDYYEEIEFETDPTNPDTDGDGIKDGREIKLGSDPNDPTSVPPFPIWAIIVIILSSIVLITMSGFLILQLSKRYKQSRLAKQANRIKADEKRLFNFLLMLKNKEKYTLQQMTALLDIRFEEIKETMALWEKKEILEKIGNYDSTKEEFERIILHDYPNDQANCYYCSQPFNITETRCPHCGFEVHFCPVCDFPLNYRDIVGCCSYCNTLCHLDHLIAFTKEKHHCPSCNHPLTTSSIKILFQELPSKIITFWEKNKFL